MSVDSVVDELFEYKNLGVLKNYVCSFASNVDDNIQKARKNSGMILSSHFNRCKQIKPTHLCQILEASMSTLPASWH